MLYNVAINSYERGATQHSEKFNQLCESELDSF